MSEYESVHMLTGKTIRVHHVSREVDDPRDYDAIAAGVARDGQLSVVSKATGQAAMLSGHEVSIGLQ